MERKIIYNYLLFVVLKDLNDFIEYNPKMCPGWDIKQYNLVRETTIKQSCKRLETLKDSNLVQSFSDLDQCTNELNDLYKKCSDLLLKFDRVLCYDNSLNINSDLLVSIHNAHYHLAELLNNIFYALNPLKVGINDKYDSMNLIQFSDEILKIINPNWDKAKDQLCDIVSKLEELFETRKDLIDCLKDVASIDFQKSDYSKEIFNFPGWKMNVSYGDVCGKYKIGTIHRLFETLLGKDKIGSYPSFRRGALSVLAQYSYSKRKKKK